MSDQPTAPPGEEPRWLDDFENVRKIYRWLWITCIALIVGGEGLLRWADSHAADHGAHHGFAFERWPGFYSIYGFVGCVALVLAAKELRRWLMRDEDYYGD